MFDALRTALPNTTRRNLLRTLGVLSALPLTGYGLRHFLTDSQAADANPLCLLSATKTEGPYWIDEHLNRSDLTTDTTRSTVLQGLPLTLTLSVINASSSACSVARNVQIDVWHADAAGEYSDVSGNGQTSTVGQTFLRGYQLTDSTGTVTFKTIYPGWYRGRTAHIHVRARVFDAQGNTTYNFTTQLFFDDVITDSVYANAPYNSRGTRDTLNSTDMHYLDGDSSNLLLNLTSQETGGYVAVGSVGLVGLPDSIETENAFDITTTTTGNLDNLSLTGTLTVATNDVGTYGSLYVAAQIGEIWYINDGNGWLPYTDDFPAYSSGMLTDTHQLKILNSVNVSTLCGANVYAGYGQNVQDMLQKNQYKKVYTVPCQ
ncbi:protocatechuate 3,4-dioxygenase beta subunit [Beggiatoa alba B18LD]|uniref:Protocatechuate 3,4-dioxygenase beta subunit n=1 Tax=Beggiatoa alba B18LD TaxID=395493 RepID=I3CHE2_9GAMM|nr:protocatechuate 3,4-dioxygenase beta subunit [Beggiatoa alba]EIJ43035.1 protocatechuate 3,4-dioxygenase beta subunit [Beggiatoa alba B18LD]